MNCLLTVAKNEKKYINEFLDYHLNLGFDRIYLVDNGNNGDLSSFDKRLVVIKDESPAIQLRAYKAVFDSLKLGDTCTVLDVDEFLYLNGKNIREFINEHLMDSDCIRLSWQVYGDNGNAKYEDKPVLERFKTPAPINCVFNKNLPQNITENWHTKYIIRKTWKQTILGIHNPTITFGISRNVLGEIVDGNSPFIKPVWEKAFVRHFLSKSCEEFAERRFNTLDACGNTVASTKVLIERYFNLNEKTPEKEAIFNKALKKENEK